MVFEMPSSEQVYAAPPAESVRERSPRRRLRRLLGLPAPGATVERAELVDPDEEFYDE
jgi:hypothetical protein